MQSKNRRATALCSNSLLTPVIIFFLSDDYRFRKKKMKLQCLLITLSLVSAVLTTPLSTLVKRVEEANGKANTEQPHKSLVARSSHSAKKSCKSSDDDDDDDDDDEDSKLDDKWQYLTSKTLRKNHFCLVFSYQY
jgi:hypothetical protein